MVEMNYGGDNFFRNLRVDLDSQLDGVWNHGGQMLVGVH